VLRLVIVRGLRLAVLGVVIGIADAAGSNRSGYCASMDGAVFRRG
jgi:hypothetical protein